MINIKFEEQLEDERILMRIPQATFENATLLFNACDKNREYLRKWLNWIDKTERPEDSFAFLKTVQNNFKEGTRAGYFIYEKSTGDFCGMCGLILHSSMYHEYGEIAYWLDADKYGKGYMTDAVRLIENAAFEKGLNRVEIRNDVENVSSSNIPKRLGYHLDGVLRQTGISFYSKTPRDVNIWSKLLSEWKK